MATHWQKALSQSYRTAKDLLEAGFISRESLPRYEALLKKYQFLLPRYYAGLIDKEDPSCPIRLQSIPQLEELEESEGWKSDPLEDLKHQPAKGVTHRYANRALLHLSPNCSMYCRYCFRKTLLNERSNEFVGASFRQGLDYVEEHSEIEEVIFSGGDPWMVTDGVLQEALDRINCFSHVKRVRFHTRVPVTLPQRVDLGLFRALTHCRKPLVIVVHFNHVRELTNETALALSRLRETGATLLNQSVLLKGVNDSAAVQVELCQALFELGVLPYYLHHPDPAAGTLSFGIDFSKGLELYRMMRMELPGYLVPRYVVDVVGEPYKPLVSEVVGASLSSFSSDLVVSQNPTQLNLPL